MALCLEFDALRIGIHGFARQAEDVGDLFIGLAVRHKLDNITLAAAQRNYVAFRWVLVRASGYVDSEHRHGFFTFIGLEVAGRLSEMNKARGDLLPPIRSMDEVRNVRCARFRERPALIPGQLVSVLVIERARQVPTVRKDAEPLLRGNNSCD